MRICLNMIVKDEAALIERCLLSVRPFIDSWVIVDTGSTDDTKEIIRRVLEGIPGVLLDRPWVNFGANRSEAVEFAQTYVSHYDLSGQRTLINKEYKNSGLLHNNVAPDFIMFMDADDQLINSEHFNPLRLAKGMSHFVKIVLGTTEYSRMLIVPNTTKWRWEGVVHEYPVPDVAVEKAEGLVSNLTVKAGVEGARSRDPLKYQKDAALLRAELDKDPHNTRNQFYLAQSLHHAQQYAEAIPEYLIRSCMGGFEEEAWYAKWQAGVCAMKLNQDAPTIEHLKDAIKRRPQRAEPALDLARFLRVRYSDFASAYAYASLAASTEYPKEDQLFIDQSVYEWQSKDEKAIAAFWLGRKEECKMLCLDLLERTALPVSERERVIVNLSHCFR